MKRIWFALTMMVFAGLGPVEAQENNPNRPGQVQLLLEIYTQLIQQAQAPDDPHCMGDVPPDVEFGVAAAPWPA